MGGRFKPWLMVGGRPILLRQIDALRGADVEHIVLVGRWSVGERPPAPVIADAIEESGSLGGLYTALLVAQGSGTIVLAGDMPLVETPLVGELIRRRDRGDAVMAVSGDGLQPLCAWYSRSLARHFKSRIERGELRIRDAVADVHVHSFGAADTTALDPDGTMLMNVNSIADYERACEAARHRT
jgi:molybdopterin-guanine dinucleotide biosynthesis protein A